MVMHFPCPSELSVINDQLIPTNPPPYIPIVYHPIYSLLCRTVKEDNGSLDVYLSHLSPSLSNLLCECLHTQWTTITGCSWLCMASP